MKARVEEPEKPENHERYLVTYADMITLLMVFFIVLWSMSNADNAKFKAVSASLSQAFNVGVLSSTEASSGGSSLLNGAGSSLVERIRNEFQQVQSEIDALRGSGPTTGSVAVEVNREGILISMYGNFLFDPGKASLNDDALVALDKIAALLLGSSNAIRVEGHTDNIAPDSVLYPSNWELSSARATSVVRHLIKDGIDPARLQAVGYGETRPLNANRTREDRARNRRVDIQIIYPQAINLSDADISSLQRGP